jgi:hypothetical protein
VYHAATLNVRLLIMNEDDCPSAKAPAWLPKF